MHPPLPHRCAEHRARRPSRHPVPASGARSWRSALALGATLALLQAGAAAQTCNGLPTSGAPRPPEARKFALIATHCPGIAEAGTPRRARQLDLYSPDVPLDAPSAIAIPPLATPPFAPPDRPSLQPVRLPAAHPAADAGRLPPEPAAPARPLDRAGQRVVDLAPTLLQTAREHGLDPLLMHAIAHVESRHDAQAVSHAGARGVMQVMPATASRLGVSQPERRLHDPATNLAASAALLRQLMARYPGELDLVLAAYNAGEGAVERHGRRVPPFAETQDYVRKVGAVYRRLSEAFAVEADGRLVARDAGPDPRRDPLRGPLREASRDTRDTPPDITRPGASS